MRSSDRLVPAFLAIDVEPDGFQLSRRNPPPWPGYGAMLELIDELRDGLTRQTGRAPRFGWYFRTDPQIAEIYGSPLDALTRFPSRTAALQSHGDYFGVHTHPLRWSKERSLWVHDFADREWLAECVQESIRAFTSWSHRVLKYFRFGASFLNNTVIDVVDRCGVEMELSLEPVAPWPSRLSKVRTAVDDSPFIGRHSNGSGAPRVPYRPSLRDFRRPSRTRARHVVLVPLTTYARRLWEPLWKRTARRLLRQRPAEEIVLLTPAVDWPSPKAFWDLVQNQLDRMAAPYLSLGVRTDAPDSRPATNVRKVLEALPYHPVAERLLFVEPEQALTTIVGENVE